MATPEAVPARQRWAGPYPCFLLSLAVPGAGQIAAGAAGRGLVLAAAGAAVLATLLFATTSSFALPVRAALLAAAFGLWLFAAYDAWFRARERDNGMVPYLRRTPRVAAYADLLWGGTGLLYLGRPVGALVALLTLGAAALAAWQGTLLALAPLAAWNLYWATRSYRAATRLFHGRPEYAALAERLASAPLDSPLAPSPSLPLATAVAACIAVAGGLMLQRTWTGMSLPSRPAQAAGSVTAGWYREPALGLALALPGEGWTFTPGRPPALLGGHAAAEGLALSLAVADHPLYDGGAVAPPDALSRFAQRQEDVLAASVPAFELLARDIVRPAERPALRLLFRSTARHEAVITAQDYVLDRRRFYVLTLSGPAERGAERIVADLDRFSSRLFLEEATQ